MESSMTEYQPPKKGWDCLQWFAVLIVLVITFSLFMPTFGVLQEDVLQTTTSNNCRQIMMALRIWANDNGGVYPDAKLPGVKTSNEVFRVLFTEEIIQDERIFGGKATRYQPDNNIGEAPDYTQALLNNENHWMMASGYQT